MKTEPLTTEERAQLVGFFRTLLDPIEPGTELDQSDALALDEMIPHLTTGDYGRISNSGANYLDRLASQYERAQHQYDQKVALNNPHSAPGSLAWRSVMAHQIRRVLELRHTSS